MKGTRELDALIAEKIFGLVPCQADCHKQDPERPNLGPISGPCHANPDSPEKGRETRLYSTEIAEAWEVAEKLNLHVVPIFDRDMKRVGWRAFTSTLHSADAETAPVAICLVALKTVGVSE